MPFTDTSFDFLNISEVYEYVDDTSKLIEETYRVLAPHGMAYLSIPNRFGFKDPHFHLCFVNWLPRTVANLFISIFGKHKDYTALSAGARQKIHQAGFSVEDIRERKLRKKTWQSNIFTCCNFYLQIFAFYLLRYFTFSFD